LKFVFGILQIFKESMELVIPSDLEKFLEKELIDENRIRNELLYISDLTNSYAKNARSKNTEKNYRTDWQDFEFWCLSKRLNSLPADPHTVAGYLADRAANKFKDRKSVERAQLKVSSIVRRLCSISLAHRLKGYELNRKHPSIQETLKGIKNTHGIAQVRKEPILIEDLRLIIQAIPIELKEKISLIGVRDRALLLLGFAGAFRRSELVSLEIRDLKLVRDGFVISLRRSKTDQQGEGREIAIPFGSNPLTCPTRALQDWIKSANINEGPVFRSINRHEQISCRALTSQSVALIVKRRVIDIEKTFTFSGHSLRAGFATTAAMAGIPEYAIMKQTGHKRSDTLKKYIRAGNLWRDNAAAKVGL
jgi:integrase